MNATDASAAFTDLIELGYMFAYEPTPDGFEFLARGPEDVKLMEMLATKHQGRYAGLDHSFLGGLVPFEP